MIMSLLRGGYIHLDKKIAISRIPIIEFILSLISTWWAIVFINSPDLFTQYPAQYATFTKILPEYGWMSMFITAASIKIVGIFMEIKLLRKIGLIMSAVIYSFISYCYFDAMGIASTGFGTYFSMATMALWGIREVDRTNG